MNRGAPRALVHGLEKSRTRLTEHTHILSEMLLVMDLGRGSVSTSIQYVRSGYIDVSVN